MSPSLLPFLSVAFLSPWFSFWLEVKTESSWSIEHSPEFSIPDSQHPWDQEVPTVASLVGVILYSYLFTVFSMAGGLETLPGQLAQTLCELFFWGEDGGVD